MFNKQPSRVYLELPVLKGNALLPDWNEDDLPWHSTEISSVEVRIEKALNLLKKNGFLILHQAAFPTADEEDENESPKNLKWELSHPEKYVHIVLDFACSGKKELVFTVNTLGKEVSGESYTLLTNDVLTGGTHAMKTFNRQKSDYNSSFVAFDDQGYEYHGLTLKSQGATGLFVSDQIQRLFSTLWQLERTLEICTYEELDRSAPFPAPWSIENIKQFLRGDISNNFDLTDIFDNHGKYIKSKNSGCYQEVMRSWKKSHCVLSKQNQSVFFDEWPNMLANITEHTHQVSMPSQDKEDVYDAWSPHQDVVGFPQIVLNHYGVRRFLVLLENAKEEQVKQWVTSPYHDLPLNFLQKITSVEEAQDFITILAQKGIQPSEVLWDHGPHNMHRIVFEQLALKIDDDALFKIVQCLSPDFSGLLCREGYDVGSLTSIEYSPRIPDARGNMTFVVNKSRQAPIHYPMIYDRSSWSIQPCSDLRELGEVMKSMAEKMDTYVQYKRDTTLIAKRVNSFIERHFLEENLNQQLLPSVDKEKPKKKPGFDLRF